ncbi:MAG: hypothetical protein AAF581_07970 [Planctomycetota bacterium]
MRTRCRYWALVIAALVSGCATTAPAPTRPARTLPARTPPAPRVTSLEEVGVQQEDPARLREGLKAQLRRALEEPALVVRDSGDSGIRGRVVDRTGRPVGGVTIRAIPLASTPDATSPEAENFDTRLVARQQYFGASQLADALLARVQSARVYLHETRQCTTDANGHYHLRGLSPTRLYDVIARHPGWHFHPLRSIASGRSVGALIRFQGTPLVAVSIDVTNADGSRPEAAQVTAIPTASTPTDRERGIFRQCDWTPQQRRIDLAPGSYVIIVAEASTENRRTSRQRFEASLEGRHRPLKFVLPDTATLTGRVDVPTDEALRDSMHVRILRVDDLQHPTGLWDLATSPTAVFAHAAHEFEFRCTGLQAGTYTVGVQWQGSNRLLATKTVLLRGGGTEISLAVPPLTPASCLTIAAKDADDEPVRNISVTARYEILDGSRTTMHSAHIARPDGDCWVPLLPPTLTQVGDISRLELTIESPLHGQTVASWRPGWAQEVACQFKRPTMLHVRVSGPTQWPLQDFAVTVMKSLSIVDPLTHPVSDVFDADQQSQQMGPDGRQTFLCSGPGKYRLVWTVKTGNATLLLEDQAVVLQQGNNTQLLTMPAMHSLRVQTRLPQGTCLQLEPVAGGATKRSRVSAQGAVTFRTLLAGTYFVSALDSPHRMTIVVPRDRSVAFAPEPPNAVLVSVFDPEGGLALAGFADGDIVCNANNYEVHTVETLLREMHASRSARRKLRVFVRRNGLWLHDRIDVYERLLRPELHGGSLTAITY